VCTYNNPGALALVLRGLAQQSFPDFEVVIADDGSREETGAIIERFAGRVRLRVRHVWHPDEGIRRNTILNRAVLAAEGDYLVFLDGDCVAPRHWLATHVAAARRGWFVSGGKVLASEKLTQQILAGRVRPDGLHRAIRRWREIRKSRRLAMSGLPVLRTLFNRNLQRRCGWNGEDSSTFAEHIRGIGGFDERFTLVWDDADFGERLKASGVRGRSIRYTAPVLHLEHGRSYRTAADLQKNLVLFLANRAAGVIVTPHGLLRHEHRSPGQPVRGWRHLNRSISA
jgi:glycosyltransferase involved in cell wall biosynthesis